MKFVAGFSIIILLLLISCKENEKFVFDSFGSKIELINIESENITEITVKETNFINSSQIKIPEKETYIGETQIRLKYEDKIIFLNKNHCDITILDSNYTIKNYFNIKGKGQGFCNGIYAAICTDSSIIVYDNQIWKFAEYRYNSEFIDERINASEKIPHNINNMVSVNGNILATGVCNLGWNNFTNGKTYPNVFLLDYKGNKLIQKMNYTPISYEKLNRTSVHFHPSINGFFIASNNDFHYIFDKCSGEIAEFKIEKQKITPTKKYILPKEVFTTHDELLYKDYQDYATDNWKKWSASGDFLLNVFFDSNYLICYISNKDPRNGMFRKKLVFVNTDNNIVERVLHTPHNRFLRYAKNGELGFLGYANEEEDLDEITLYKIDYTKLF